MFNGSMFNGSMFNGSMFNGSMFNGSMFNGSMFNHVLFNHVLSLAAAFGFVAFVLVFVHPASHAGRAAVHQTSAGSAVAAIAASDAGVRSHLAATK
jgi:hypothetical protein